jgi:ribosomal protein S18 acetylase RimI-like enzyme
MPSAADREDMRAIARHVGDHLRKSVASCRADRSGMLIGRPHEIPVATYEQTITELKTKGVYLVAEENGSVIGHAFLNPLRLEAISHVFLLTIVVYPDWTGRGVGSSLMTELLTWARRERRVGKIELLVRDGNVRELHLYRKFGFIEEGRLTRRVRLPDGRFIDDIAMAGFPRERCYPSRDVEYCLSLACKYVHR